MRITPRRDGFRDQRGLTLMEVLVVVGVLVILAGMVLPPMAMANAKAGRIKCIGELKAIGLAYRIFSTDHGGGFPWGLSVTNGGSREWLGDDPQIWRHWVTVTNFLRTPALLICPEDEERQPPKHYFTDPKPLVWAQITNNSRLSYFLGLNAREDIPDTILAGDRNLTIGGVPVPSGRLLLRTNDVLGFTEKVHDSAGNILLGDGSVQQVTSSRLRECWTAAQMSSGLSTNVWLVP